MLYCRIVAVLVVVLGIDSVAGWVVHVHLLECGVGSVAVGVGQ